MSASERPGTPPVPPAPLARLTVPVRGRDLVAGLAVLCTDGVSIAWTLTPAETFEHAHCIWRVRTSVGWMSGSDGATVDVIAASPADLYEPPAGDEL